ncbi:MAG: phosphoribosylanthranilate isomerase, partial [Coleofasciculaceae cyanobacterium SM2_3_26]|nr:phosphoribosylanthranilate isomerase [Coleofasciculaceae cyanobacterium SM2_3_26]
MRIKICGITRPDQAQAIAQLGVDTLGFICVSQTPRYIAPDLIRAIAETLTAASLPVARIGVFANASLEEVIRIAKEARFTGVQLHGQEDPTFCQQLRQQLPEMETIKSFRIQTTADLESTVAYEPHVDTLLLDAYHPGKLGGTGQAIDWCCCSI